MIETKKRVMVVNQYKDAITYRVACACGSPEHDIYVAFELDKELPDMISLEFYKDVYYFDYYRRDVLWFDEFRKIFKEGKRKESIKYILDNTIVCFFKNLWYRIKKATRLVFTGHLEMNEDFILQGEDHVNNFIDILKEGKNFIKENRDERSRIKK